MNLTIRTERGTAVFFIIELVSKDDFTRTEAIGDTILSGEIIQPHDDMMKQMHQHDLREFSVWEGAEDTTATLLDDSDPALNVAVMLRCSSSIDNNVGGMLSNLIELIVHQYCLNGETCTSVNCHDSLK